MAKTAAELYQERVKRVKDAIELREPDRVPFLPFCHFFPARYAGMTFKELMYDYDKLEIAWKKVILDFEPDMYVNPYGLVALGPTMEALDYKQLRWPGHGVGDDVSYQFVEGEYMRAEEYDEFLFDPTGFMVRTLFPRICGILEPLKLLSPVPWAYYIRIIPAIAVLGVPEVAASLQAALKAGAEAYKVVSRSGAFVKEMESLGFQAQLGAGAYAPFDYIGDFLRGTKGIMLDMYRNPEKLLAATEKVLPIMISSGATTAKKAGIPRVFIPLHKGLDGFMSLEQFKTFYWPTLRKLILGLIDSGLTPCVLFEGDCTSRLEVIRDVPAGKAIYWFERTDLVKAKEVLGDKVCLRGNVPPSLLCTGTPGEVKDYCQKLIKVIGKGGGFILDGAAGIPDEAKAENVKAMAESVRG